LGGESERGGDCRKRLRASYAIPRFTEGKTAWYESFALQGKRVRCMAKAL
jgi:hypothetical protein